MINWFRGWFRKKETTSFASEGTAFANERIRVLWADGNSQLFTHPTVGPLSLAVGIKKDDMMLLLAFCSPVNLLFIISAEESEAIASSLMDKVAEIKRLKEGDPIGQKSSG